MIKLSRDSIVQVSHDTALVYHYSDIITGDISKLNDVPLSEDFNLKNDYFISENGFILFVEKETTAVDYKPVFVVPVIRESDTMRLNSLKYLNKGDGRSASEIITISPRIEAKVPQNDLNGVVNSFVFGFMVFFTVVYVARSFSNWCNMMAELKFALKP
jgi:hypothetical protein